MSSELSSSWDRVGDWIFGKGWGAGEMSTYLAGYRKVVTVVRWFLLDDMAG